MKEVKAHELDHVDIIKHGYEEKNGYDGVIKQMVCKSAEDARSALLQRSQDIRDGHEKYDKDTNHGKDQGAILNPNIK